MRKSNRDAAKRNMQRAEADIPYPAAKACSRCAATKPAADFPKARRETDGLKSYCKDCGKAWRADWYRRNREREIQKTAAYQLAHPDKVREWAKTTYYHDLESTRAKARARHAAKSEIVAANRERYATDPEYRAKILEGQRKAHAANPARMREYQKRYAAENPDKIKVIVHRRLAKAHEAGGECTASEWHAVKEFFGYCCAYCLRPETAAARLTIDHLVPLSRGGTNDPDNIAPACRSCNSAKNDRTVLEFVMGMSPTRAFKKISTF